MPDLYFQEIQDHLLKTKKEQKNLKKQKIQDTFIERIWIRSF